MSIEITTKDEQALRAFVKRKPRNVHELRSFLRGRVDVRSIPVLDVPEYAAHLDGYAQRLVVDRLIEDAANRAVVRLIRKWKSAGLVDNATRGTWSWTGK